MNKSPAFETKNNKKEAILDTKEKEVLNHKKTEENKKVEKDLKRIEEKIAGVEREIEVQTVAIGQLDFSNGETHSDLLSAFELKKTELSILMSEWEEKMGKL